MKGVVFCGFCTAIFWLFKTSTLLVTDVSTRKHVCRRLLVPSYHSRQADTAIICHSSIVLVWLMWDLCLRVFRVSYLLHLNFEFSHCDRDASSLMERQWQMFFVSLFSVVLDILHFALHFYFASNQRCGGQILDASQGCVSYELIYSCY